MSDNYCTQFRLNHQGNNEFIAHLVCSLNQEKNKEKLSFEQLSQKYIPKYLFDWRYVDDPKTGGKYRK